MIRFGAKSIAAKDKSRFAGYKSDYVNEPMTFH